MDWSEVLKIAGTAGVSAAIVTQVLVWGRESFGTWRRKTANAAYLAIRIAVVLEGFAAICSEVVSEIRNFESSRGIVGSATKDLPQLAPYPVDDESWRAIDLELVEEVLSLPNKIPASQRGIDFAGEVGCEDDISQRKCLEEACQLGLEALRLAKRLRKRYKFSAYKPGYDYAAYLQEAADEASEHRRAESEAQASMWSKALADPQASKFGKPA